MTPPIKRETVNTIVNIFKNVSSVNEEEFVKLENLVNNEINKVIYGGAEADPYVLNLISTSLEVEVFK